MERPQSGEMLFKLGQKYRGASQHEGETTMTNMYLSAGEYQRLSALPAREIVKKRYRYEQNGRAYGIDVFEGGLTGLILAEIECETQPEYEQMEIPAFASRDVTGELFFTGGNLAGLTKEAFGAGLARWRGDSDFGQTLPNQLTAPDRSL